MSNPYFWLPIDRQELVVAGLSMTTTVLMVARYVIGYPLRTRLAGVPSRVVAMEIPLSLQRTEARIRIWRERGVIQRAVLKTRLDFLFLLFYPATLSLVCVMLAQVESGASAVAGITLSWSVLLCIPIGLTTNSMILGMLREVRHPQLSPGYVALLRLLAFFLAVMTLVYIAFMTFV